MTTRSHGERDPRGGPHVDLTGAVIRECPHRRGGQDHGERRGHRDDGRHTSDRGETGGHHDAATHAEQAREDACREADKHREGRFRWSHAPIFHDRPPRFLERPETWDV